MKVVKGILSFLIGFIVMILISLLVSSFLFKDLIQNQLIGNVIKTEMVSDIVENSDIENKEEILDALGDDELNNIVNNVINDYVDAIKNGTSEVSDETVNSIINYTIEHKDAIESITNEKIDIEELKSQESFNELSNSLNEVLKETDEFGQTERNIFKAYGSFTSTKFRIILIVVIVALIGLLMLIKGSVYEWISNFGGSLIASGILISLIYVAFKFIIKVLIEEKTINFDINTSNMLIVGIVEIIVGIALIIIKNQLKKRKMNNDILPENITSE